jgi:hypothetical protein
MFLIVSYRLAPLAASGPAQPRPWTSARAVAKRPGPRDSRARPSALLASGAEEQPRASEFCAGRRRGGSSRGSGVLASLRMPGRPAADPPSAGTLLARSPEAKPVAPRCACRAARAIPALRQVPSRRRRGEGSLGLSRAVEEREGGPAPAAGRAASPALERPRPAGPLRASGRPNGGVRRGHPRRF